MSWHTLGLWTTIVLNFIQIHIGSEELWPRHGFWECAGADLGGFGGVRENPPGVKIFFFFGYKNTQKE